MKISPESFIADEGLCLKYKSIFISGNDEGYISSFLDLVVSSFSKNGYLKKNIFENNRFNLIEACAESIGYALLDEFKKIEEIKVLVKKPAVPVDCICEYFAAEVTLCR